ncbi:MAG: IS481 family transposase [Microbacterium sp.]|uniref:IS481 family transposase n=1 Tax=unclassified Microbacterium TaxID=2609290 RepID=UPI000C6B6361|nr:MULTISPECIES: IS481 family transposase [unclassified Microbacterium]MAY49463.1 IS481 family transposase [Microbacterium sp.]HAS32265.1 IS481 family transposase [Microbacterium sp.]HBS74469.1 IS481 family transposase [Microbacterium sp.]|tara:strand:+ start:922 stop:2109 length:1188 start_codon:yes stop_codon:yes gene_type:complete
MSSKHRVVVLKIVAGQLSVTDAAQQYGISRRHLHRLLARYRQQGLDGLDARSRAPRSSPHAVTDPVRDRIVQLRHALTAAGADAGPVTIAWHLSQEGLRTPSTSTIRRVLHTAGLITPGPRKRPRSSYVRFEAAQPNETWQSDFTHWRLAGGTDVEILNWLDDHSRLLLSCTAHQPVTGRHVVDTFLTTIDTYGPPASTLTDNGRVYTARHGGGRNEFEYVLAALNIVQKNGTPNHPQTQGKIERFHQTLKRWLDARPRAATIPELKAQLEQFQNYYNTHRPHRARDGITPAAAYAASPKAAPAGHTTDIHYRVRHDHVDTNGKISFRRAARMHYLGVGTDHRGTTVLILADDTTVTIVAIRTGEIIATNTIDPNKTYWRNTMKAPGRWREASKT